MCFVLHMLSKGARSLRFFGRMLNKFFGERFTKYVRAVARVEFYVGTACSSPVFLY